MNVREKISEIIERELNSIPEDIRDSTHKFYYRDYKDNLIRPMADRHVEQYKAADGGEMETKGNKPAKMASLTSSSAMTFNILGNVSLVIKEGQPFSPGIYEIAYEKQMNTLNKGSNPANLDAFLANRSTGEAIFCEMKMMEWIGNPNPLKEAYCNSDYYFDADSFNEVFKKIIDALYDKNIPDSKNAYPSIFKQYDAWQMFKHTLAVYNTVSHVTKESMSAKTGSMAGEFKTITLANIVFEMDLDLIEDETLRTKYAEALEREHKEAKDFIDIMLSPENGLKKLFKVKCGVDFDIRYIPVHEFVSMIDKTDNELKELQRYCCK